MKFIHSFVYPIIRTIKNPKFIKYDNFWNMYYLNEKLFHDFSFQLKYYNHNCIQNNEINCCKQNFNLINTDLEIKIKDFEMKELTFTYFNEKNKDDESINIEKYILEKKNKNDHTSSLNHLLNKDYDILQNLHLYSFVAHLNEFLQENIPGKNIWSNIEKEKGYKLYQQIIFYLNQYEKTKSFAKKISKIYIINENNQFIFKYKQNIRLQMIQDELSQLQLENDPLLNKLIIILKELDYLYD